MKPVKRRRRKKLALARSRKRHARFLEKKLAGKPDLASPEEDQQDTDINPVCVKELENTSLACGSNRDLVSSENPAPSPASDPDLLSVSEQAILCEILDTIDSDDSDNDVVVSSASVYMFVLTVSNHPKKERTLNVVRAVNLPATAASSARGRIGTFTGLLVPLWPRSRTL